MEEEKTLKEKYDAIKPEVWDHLGGVFKKLKLTPLEADNVRPMHPYEKCDIDIMGVELCLRHNSDYSAPHTMCKREINDLYECLAGFQKKRQIKKLLDASHKAGDKIPFMGFQWRY